MFHAGGAGITEHMGAPTRSPITAPRRVEALAYIITSIRVTGSCPSYGEIGKAMNPPVQGSRAAQYVDQLVKLGVIERPLASRRGIRIRDFDKCRQMIHDALGAQGFCQARQLGELEPPPYTIEQLPVLRLIELIPDVD